MSRKRNELQLALADIVGRRYGVQVTTSNQHGVEIYVTWKNAGSLLKDLQRLEDLDGRKGW